MLAVAWLMPQHAYAQGVYIFRENSKYCGCPSGHLEGSLRHPGQDNDGAGGGIIRGPTFLC